MRRPRSLEGVRYNQALATVFPAQIVWHASAAWPLVLAVAAILVVGLSWQYPPQVRRVRGAWRFLPPMLRAAALLGLAASLLQPAVIRRMTRDERGAVVVLLDTSRSMGVRDTGRTPAQRVALADGLGRLPSDRRTIPSAEVEAEIEALRGLLDDAERARTDLGYARAAGRGVEAAQQRVRGGYERIAESAKSLAKRAGAFDAGMALHRSLLALGELPFPPRGRDAWLAELRRRTDAAAAAAGDLQRDADARLHADDAATQRIADELNTQSRLELSQSALRGEKGLLAALSGDVPVRVLTFDGELNGETSAGDALRAEGFASDVVGAPADALRKLSDRAVRAVVLFSDGRQVGVRRSVVSALPAGGSRVPVFAVNPVSAPVKDVSIVRVATPSDAFVGETVAVRVELRSLIVEGTTTIRLDGTGIHEARQVVLRPNQTTPTTFSFQPTAPGPVVLSVGVEPMEGEATLENNRVERWLRVLPRRLRVVAAGTPTRDFLLMREALARASFVQLHTETLDPIRPALATPSSELRDSDVLLFVDVPASALNESRWTAVNDLVVRRGGSVVIASADPRRLEGYADNLLAAPLLPFSPDYRPTQRVWPGERPAFHFTPAPGVDWLGGGSSDEGNGGWDALPGVFRFMNLGKLKTGAAPILVESDSGAAVATETRVGAGRSFFIGLNETWRWRHAAASGVADRFWRQFVRHAAEAPYLADDGVFAFDADRQTAVPGEPINIRARCRVELGAHATSLAVQVLQQGEVFQMAPLRPVGAEGSGRFATKLQDVPIGEFTLRLVGSSAPSLQLPLRVAAGAEAEMVDVSADERTLRAIASTSGGEYLPIEQVSRLPSLLSSQGRSTARLTETRLWDHPLLFVFIVACLGAEWSLRKRFGLA